MVVDQPASIGALAIAVARVFGVAIAYLPGLAMRRIADLYPGEGKTDIRDAFVIADAARTLPHALRRVGNDEETLSALGVLAGYDADLAAEATPLTNRLHDALLHVHPALERLLGKLFRRPSVLQLLAVAGTPDRLSALGPHRHRGRRRSPVATHRADPASRGNRRVGSIASSFHSGHHPVRSRHPRRRPTAPRRPG